MLSRRSQGSCTSGERQRRPAFRATLEEVLVADLILHIRDISHPQSAEQAGNVAAILKDLGVAVEAPLLEV